MITKGEDSVSPANSALPALKLDSTSPGPTAAEEAALPVSSPSSPLLPTQSDSKDASDGNSANDSVVSERMSLKSLLPSSSHSDLATSPLVSSSPNRVTSAPHSPKDRHHEKHAPRGLTTRDLVSEINLSKDEYFNWSMPLEPNLRLEPVLAVVTTRLYDSRLNFLCLIFP